MRFHPLIFIISSLIFLTATNTIAQNRNIKDQLSGEAARADKLFEQQAYLQATDLYRSIVKKHPENSDAKLKLAESLRMLHNNSEAEYWFSEGLKNPKENSSVYILHYAETLLTNGKNTEALQWFEKYSQDNAKDGRGANKSKSINSYQDFYKDSLVYSVKAMPINSNESDFSPAFYQKGIVFLSSRKEDEKVKLIKRENATDGSEFLNIYYTEISSDNNFKSPVRLPDFGATLHEGPLTFFDNGNKVIFSRNVKGKSKGGYARLALYSAVKSSDGKWTSIQMLPFVSSDYSYSHPYYDERNNTLYFTSDMAGGFGATDIYKTEFKNNSWTIPQNLGATINTEGNEMFPFFSKDSCLYFTSNGHPGMGGLDNFRAYMNEETITVENLGYPVNTKYDDFALIMAEKGSKGFLCSNRKQGGANDDIYQFEVHSVRFEGTVVDKLKASPLNDVLVKMTEIGAAKVEPRVFHTNGRGRFYSFVKPGKHYSIEVFKENYESNKVEVYCASKEESMMRKSIIIEKYNKSFVTGKVVMDTSFLSHCMVKIIDVHADSVETMYTDSLGQFQCEINTDTSNIFYIEKGKLRGITKVEPAKRKRKGSGMSFITVEAGEILMQKLEGKYLDSLGAPLVNETLYLKNELNGEEIIITPSEGGKFKVDLWLYGKYSFFTKENDKKILLKTIIVDKMDALEVRKRKLPAGDQ